jgi:acyl carrier protein
LLCGDIEDHFNVEIDPADIFEYDTVGAFAQSILTRMVT